MLYDNNATDTARLTLNEDDVTLCFASVHITCILVYISTNVLHTVSNFRRAAYARDASTARAVGPWSRECQNCEATPNESSKACRRKIVLHDCAVWS